MTLRVVHGNPGEDDLALARYAEARSTTWWTAPKDAGPGDPVAFYFRSPISAFLATGEVQSRTDNGSSDRGQGRYVAQVGRIVMLAPPTTLREVADAIPDWGWARNPQSGVTSLEDDQQVDMLLRLLRVRRASRAETAEENMRREQRALSRTRNRRLRDEKVKHSRGVCEACKLDYAALADDRWRSLLQAHHLRPLALDDETRVSTLDDLAAVCPTCHRLLHLEPDDEPALSAVRDRLRDAGLLP